MADLLRPLIGPLLVPLVVSPDRASARASKKPRIRLSGSQSLLESAASGTTVGALSVANHPSGGTGWTFTITADADAKFAIATANLNTAAGLDYETKTAHSVTIKAAKTAQADIFATFTINVTNVFEAASLNALALDDTSVPVGAAATINITGATSGSTIALAVGSLPAGMTLNSGARTITGTPSAVALASFTLRETLADSANSPRDTALSVDVFNSGSLDPDLTPPTYSLIDAANVTPIRLNIDVATFDPAEYLELLVTSDLAQTATVINPSPVVIGTGDIVFTGLSGLSTGPYYLWIRRWNAALSAHGNWPALPVKWGDVTAPTLSSPTGTQTGGTTATVAVTSNEAEGTIYWTVLPSASATPIATDFLAGSTGGVASGSTASPLAGSNSFSATGLADGTGYKAHFFHRDLAGNNSAVSSSTTFTTPDITAPTLTSPVDSTNGATGATLAVDTSEGNGTLYWFISTSATPPTASALKAGTGAVVAGSQSVSASGTQNVSPTGLTASTAYYGYFLHRDTAGNDSAVSAGNGFTTAAPPTLTTWVANSGVVRSNGNLTATSSATSTDWAFASTAHGCALGELRYFEITAPAGQAGFILGFSATQTRSINQHMGFSADLSGFFSYGNPAHYYNTAAGGNTSVGPQDGGTIALLFYRPNAGSQTVALLRNGTQIDSIDISWAGDTGVLYPTVGFQNGFTATISSNDPAPAGYTYVGS